MRISWIIMVETQVYSSEEKIYSDFSRGYSYRSIPIVKVSLIAGMPDDAPVICRSPFPWESVAVRSVTQTSSWMIESSVSERNIIYREHMPLITPDMNCGEMNDFCSVISVGYIIIIIWTLFVVGIFVI